MIDMAYVDEHLSSRRLRLLAPAVTLNEGYYLLRRPVRRNDWLLGAFEQWILAVSARSRPEAGGNSAPPCAVLKQPGGARS